MSSIQICATFPPIPSYQSIAQSVHASLKGIKLPSIPGYPAINFPAGLLSIKPPVFSGMTSIDLECSHIISELNSLVNASVINLIYKALSLCPGFSDLLNMLKIPFLGIGLADLLSGNIDWTAISSKIIGQMEAILGFLGLPFPLYGSFRAPAIEIPHIFTMLKNQFYNMCFDAITGIIGSILSVVNFPPFSFGLSFLLGTMSISTLMKTLIKPIVDKVENLASITEAEIKTIYTLLGSLTIPPFLAPQGFTYPLFSATRIIELEVQEMAKQISTVMSGGYVSFIIDFVNKLLGLLGIKFPFQFSLCIPIPLPNIPSFNFGIPVIDIPSLPKIGQLSFKRLAATEGIIKNAEFKAMSTVNKAVSKVAAAEKSALQKLAQVQIMPTDAVLKAAISISKKEAQALNSVNNALSSITNSIASAENAVAGSLSSALNSAVAPINQATASINKTIINAVTGIDGSITKTISGVTSAIGKIGKILSILSLPPLQIFEIPKLPSLEKMVFNKLAAVEAIVVGKVVKVESSIQNSINSVTNSVSKSISQAETKVLGPAISSINGALNSVASAEKQAAAAVSGALNAITSVTSTVSSIGSTLSTINGTLSSLSSLTNSNIQNLLNGSAASVLSFSSIKFPIGIKLPTFNIKFPKLTKPILSIPSFPTLVFKSLLSVATTIADAEASALNTLNKSLSQELAALNSINNPTTDQILKQRIAINKKIAKQMLKL